MSSSRQEERDVMDLRHAERQQIEHNGFIRVHYCPLLAQSSWFWLLVVIMAEVCADVLQTDLSCSCSFSAPAAA